MFVSPTNAIIYLICNRCHISGIHFTIHTSFISCIAYAHFIHWFSIHTSLAKWCLPACLPAFWLADLTASMHACMHARILKGSSVFHGIHFPFLHLLCPHIDFSHTVLYNVQLLFHFITFRWISVAAILHHVSFSVFLVSNVFFSSFRIFFLLVSCVVVVVVSYFIWSMFFLKFSIHLLLAHISSRNVLVLLLLRFIFRYHFGKLIDQFYMYPKKVVHKYQFMCLNGHSQKWRKHGRNKTERNERERKNVLNGKRLSVLQMETL